MKVLITGKNSYVGKNIGNFLLYKNMEVKYVSVRNGISEDEFTDVDVVVHCAAIVHKKEAKFAILYDKVNYELTVDIAEKAKKKGVKQFIFMSTMAVYGKSEGEINGNTPLQPKTLYGESKLKAEKALEKIADALGVPVTELFEKPNASNVIGFVKVGDTVHEVKSAEDVKNLVGKL